MATSTNATNSARPEYPTQDGPEMLDRALLRRLFAYMLECRIVEERRRRRLFPCCPLRPNWNPYCVLSVEKIGVEFSPRDLRFRIIEASQGKTGTLVDQVLLYCFHYDPRSGKYGAIITRVVQLAGAATILLLGGFMLLMFRLEPKHQRKARSGGHS